MTYYKDKNGSRIVTHGCMLFAEYVDNNLPRKYDRHEIMNLIHKENIGDVVSLDIAIQEWTETMQQSTSVIESGEWKEEKIKTYDRLLSALNYLKSIKPKEDNPENHIF